MKLNLGENIRNLRKTADLTQEQLADKLGVSYQSVSRWENGMTYPDMEFIPSLTELFGVSADMLFGIPERKKETTAKEALTELAKASFENPVNIAKVNELIRDIRRNYLGCECFWNFWMSVNQNTYRIPEILPEVRLTAEAIIDGNYDIWEKNDAIKRFSSIEDEEHIINFLNRYASDEEMSKNALLYIRYMNIGNREKSDPLRQQFLFRHIDELIGNSSMWHERKELYDFKKSMLQNRLCITLLHNLCSVEPDEDHPISGDGEVDFWVEPRMWMGIYETGYLAFSGEKEKAFTVLEDTVTLLEKAMRITSPVELRCSSPWLDKTVWIAEEDWSHLGGSPLLETEQERCIWIHDEAGCCYVLYPSLYYSLLSATEDNQWFTRNCKYLDPIRKDQRYQNYVDRVKALVVTRPKAN